MKQPDLALYEAIRPFLESNGFKFIKSRCVFIRKQDYGFDEFMWYTHPVGEQLPKWLGGHYAGSYGIGLRHDKVAEIMEILDLIGGAANKKYASTVHRAVTADYFPFNIIRDKELRLPFNKLEKSAAEVAVRIKDMFETDGFNWFVKYSNPNVLSEEINDPIEIRGSSSHSLVNNPDQRPLIGVAASCVGDPDRVSDLVELYIAAAIEYDSKNFGKVKPVTELFEKRFEQIVINARELGYL